MVLLSSKYFIALLSGMGGVLLTILTQKILNKKACSPILSITTKLVCRQMMLFMERLGLRGMMLRWTTCFYPPLWLDVLHKGVKLKFQIEGKKNFWYFAEYSSNRGYSPWLCFCWFSNCFYKKRSHCCNCCISIRSYGSCARGLFC